jgi:glycine C-acetyltransferase/8-amino-7-oxononanoate synthase
MTDVAGHLADLRRQGLYRALREVGTAQGAQVRVDGDRVLLLCSDNYLGLADHPRVRAAATDAITRWGVGSGASRLISGTMAVHGDLEERLARFHGTDAALLFGSRYLANTGTVAALAGAGEVVYSDQQAHASIVDGCRLSRAETRVYRHRDTDHLAWLLADAGGRGGLIVTDGIFSVDGDVAPLAELLELARRHRVRLMVDESHATGAIGPGGRGTVAAAGLAGEVDVVIGSLGKALGAFGAFAACSSTMADYLANSVRTFMFATAPAPPLAAAAIAALELIEERPELPRQLQENAAVLRGALRAEGFDMPDSDTQLMPLAFGDPEVAMAVCERALAGGVYAQALCPPTVPAGSSRLRLAVMATQTPAQLTSAARILARAADVAPGAPERRVAIDPATH